MYKTQDTREQFSDLLENLSMNSVIFTPRTATYNEMVASGHLKDLKNDTLKTALLNLYNDYEFTRSRITEMDAFSENMYRQIAFDIMKYRPGFSMVWRSEEMFSDKEWAFVNNPGSDKFRRLETTAGYYGGKHIVHKNHYNRLLVKIRKLLELIDEELH